jgi:hypothetical protein
MKNITIVIWAALLAGFFAIFSALWFVSVPVLALLYTLWDFVLGKVIPYQGVVNLLSFMLAACTMFLVYLVVIMLIILKVRKSKE